MTRWNEQIDAAQSVCLSVCQSTVSVRESYPPQCAHADNCISQTQIDKTVAICKLPLIRNINHYKGQNAQLCILLLNIYSQRVLKRASLTMCIMKRGFIIINWRNLYWYCLLSNHKQTFWLTEPIIFPLWFKIVTKTKEQVICSTLEWLIYPLLIFPWRSNLK